jgi:hypothetical protein
MCNYLCENKTAIAQAELDGEFQFRRQHCYGQRRPLD